MKVHMNFYFKQTLTINPSLASVQYVTGHLRTEGQLREQCKNKTTKNKK